MFEKFKNHVQQNFSFLEEKSLYLAVSGGLDSMVLCHLFQQLPFKFSILHCNFTLRGVESDEDELFVRNYCDTNLIECTVATFDTKLFARENKVSTQIAARTLRYEWFEKQLIDNQFDFLLTAHHLDDCLETFIINLSRGTGIEGLIGIPAQNKKVIRPLLPFSRAEINSYATVNNVTWREDSSNASSEYLRNKIRHDVVPSLKELEVNFLKNFGKTLNYLKQSNQLINDALENAATFVIEKKDDDIYFHIDKLLQLSDYKTYLYYWLAKFNFKSWDDIYDLVTAENGKKVVSDDFQIQKYRSYLIVSKLFKNINSERYHIFKNDEIVNFPINLALNKVSVVLNESEQCIFADFDKLRFPLEIRTFKSEDVFYPKGMKGSKKVNKYLKDAKISPSNRERVWLLVDAFNTVIWIIGYRQDQRFAVNAATTQLINIKVTS